jgi:NAD(P)-dependent dehydrogenase (short-subunit alcohol dehydrogenase family)
MGEGNIKQTSANERYLSNIILTFYSRGIGLETCILFAKEGANVLMADISAPALEKASAKLRQLVPSAHKVDIKVPSKA